MTEPTTPRTYGDRPAAPWARDRATRCPRCAGAGHYRGAITGRDVSCKACGGTGRRQPLSGPALEAVSWPGATWQRRLSPADVQDVAMTVLLALAAIPWLIVLRR